MVEVITNKTIFNVFPASIENPLMDRSHFIKYCQRRFKYLPSFEKDFALYLEELNELEFLLPIYIEKNTYYYSSFQIYQLKYIENIRKSLLLSYRKESFIYDWRSNFKEFKDNYQKVINRYIPLLKLLITIQDFYIPFVRTDMRLGELREYMPKYVIGGGFTSISKSKVSLSYLENSSRKMIKNGKFNPQKILDEMNINVDYIIHFLKGLTLEIESNNPINAWNDILKYFDYDKKQKLVGDALISQDFYEINASPTNFCFLS
jgi:hypothetical protein